MTSRLNKKISGQTLIEPILAIAIFGMILTPFIGSAGNLLASQVKYRRQIQASQYAREGIEIVYNIAVNTDDWHEYFIQDDNHLGTFQPTSSNTLDLVVSSGEQIGIFTREIIISRAKRDGNNDIDEIDGTPVDDTIKVVSKVTWENRGVQEEISLTTYLIDLGTQE